jgi:Transcriptional regulator
MTQKDKRGPYAKGIAKREEILTRTLDVIAREGYRGASVKELAEAVGLTQAGLLYHFGTKEELFAEILRKRDELDSAGFDSDKINAETDLLTVVRHNAEVPGLVQLFSQMAVESADPEHPAHDFFTRHGEVLRQRFIEMTKRRRQIGEFAGSTDPETIARIIQAATDGLQLQWLLDPSIDMAAVLETLFTLLDDEQAKQA